MRKILGSGAEATIYLNTNNNVVDKERSKKEYRHEVIDSTLRKARTKKEAKILKALEPYGFAPKLIIAETKKDVKSNSSQDTDFESTISMEYIDGVQLKKILDKNIPLAELIGKNLTIMHDLNIIHGDLTTSNMILVDTNLVEAKITKNKTTKRKNADVKKSSKLFFIDFGLSFNSSKIEDKAVDIHVFKQALESKHFRVYADAYEIFLKAYNPKMKKEILERLDTVEQRGRYKEKT